MTMLKARLEEAVETGEILRVQYFSGSQPGAIRDLAPIRVDDTYVLAHCFVAERVKKYRLDRMALVEDGALPGKDQTVFAVDVAGFARQHHDVRDLGAVFQAIALYCEALGWVVEQTEDEFLIARTLTVRSRFKNGKVQKGDFCSLNHAVLISDGEMALPAGGTTPLEPRKRHKPWTVRTKSAPTMSFSDASMALRAFYSAIEEYAPSPTSEVARPEITCAPKLKASGGHGRVAASEHVSANRSNGVLSRFLGWFRKLGKHVE